MCCCLAHKTCKTQNHIRAPTIQQSKSSDPQETLVLLHNLPVVLAQSAGGCIGGLKNKLGNLFPAKVTAQHCWCESQWQNLPSPAYHSPELAASFTLRNYMSWRPETDEVFVCISSHASILEKPLLHKAVFFIKLCRRSSFNKHLIKVTAEIPACTGEDACSIQVLCFPHSQTGSISFGCLHMNIRGSMTRNSIGSSH